MIEQELQAIIFQELQKVAPESNPADLGPDENIRESLDIDSFSFLRVLVGLSERTGIDIPEADYGKVPTLATMTAYLTVHLH
jgi:acyl carrier protein